MAELDPMPFTYLLTHPNEFDWRTAPLNKPWQPIAAGVIYLILIYALERRSKFRPLSVETKGNITKIQSVHNLAISLGSLGMVLGTIISAAVTKAKTGIPVNFFCETSPPPATGLTFFWVYIFYLTKYWELLDTILQMSKGRRPPSYFFHIWHHVMYLQICYYYCVQKSSLAAQAVLVNGSVHVCMYYYYYLVSTGTIPWWKKYITSIQIVQFIYSFVCCALYLKAMFLDNRPCNGGKVLTVNALFNITMLIGFLQIFNRITTSEQAEKKSEKAL